MNTPRSIVYISWAANCSRSDHTARELGGVSHMVYWDSLGSHPLTVWLKYLGQAVRTLRLLLREHPSAVFVMTPPVFAPLVAWTYCALRKSPLVLDAHTTAFLHPRWRYFQWLQFWLCRRAATTIVHNDHLKALVESHGGHATLVSDIPIRFDRTEPFALSSGFNVAAVCSFNPDEPIEQILDAASRLPDVRFYMTGNPKHLAEDLKRRMPPNVTLTGFLSTEAYGSLLQNADAVMSLTLRDHTMLRGAWEATYQGTPVVVSDWPVLKSAFDEGAVHVDNTADGIARGIRQIQQNPQAYRQGARSLMARKEQRWHATRESLRNLLRAPVSSGRPST